MDNAKGKMVRRIIVHIAMSADGYVACPGGIVEWLEGTRIAGNNGMSAFYRSIGAVLWGCKTYETALRFEKESKPGAAFDRKIKNYVFSHNPPEESPPGVDFVRERIHAFAARLRASPGKSAWMMGGAGLIGSFMDVGELEEFIIHLMPKFIGEGIPLFAPRHRSVALSLRCRRRFSDGVVRLHYSVDRSAAGAFPPAG